MAKQIQRLAPLRGLNPMNVSAEAGLQGTFMRGGYNVEVFDAEWWVRHGCAQSSENLGSVWWRWIVSSPELDRLFLVSNDYVLQIEGRVADVGVQDNTTFFRQLVVPYQQMTANLDATFTVGSPTVTVNLISGAVPQKGYCFVAEGTGGVPDRFYRIIDVPTATLWTLDRPYQAGSPTSITGLKFYSDLMFTFAASPGVQDSDLNGGCCLFEQTATHAANTLGYANYAVDPGSYIIVISSIGYAAVAIAPAIKPLILGTWLRQTQLPTPTAVTMYNVKPCVYKDRLFLSAADPTMPNTVSYRTFWYSRPFDFMQWHTGLQGLGGTPNFFTLNDPTDPISGFMVLGDALVVHRRNSQDLIQTYGSGFKASHNDSGIGFWPRSMMESIPVGHIGWTRYGPGLFNDQGMTVMFPEIERMLTAFNQSERMNPRLRGVIHDQNRRRIYFLLGWEAVGFVDTPTEYGTRRIIRHQDALLVTTQQKPFSDQVWYSRCPVLVVDYARNETWLEDYAGLCGGGDHLGQMYLCRYDGTVVAQPTGWSGKDFDVARINAATPVDAMVETQWMNHGSEQRKMLQKIYLTFRALDVNEDVDEILGGKFDPLRISDLWDSPTDTLHFCTVEVMADHRDDVQASSDVSVLVSDMLGRSMEGNRMLPVMLFSITPRVAGRAFKYRFKTALSPAAQAAGHKLGSFRLVDAVIELDVESDTRAAGLTGGSP